MSRMKIAACLMIALGILLLLVEEPRERTACSRAIAKQVHDRLTAAGAAAKRHACMKLAYVGVRARPAGRRLPPLIVV